jgi:hypothetical protein
LRDIGYLFIYVIGSRNTKEIKQDIDATNDTHDVMDEVVAIWKSEDLGMYGTKKHHI